MPSEILQTQGMSFTDMKNIFWIAGAIVSAAVTGIGVSWWFSQQLSTTRRDIYIKMNKNHKELQDRASINKDECRDTKERVTLLELTKEHHEKEMDKMGDSLRVIKEDLSATKESVNALSQKSTEDTHSIMEHIRSTESRHQVGMLEMKEAITNTILRMSSHGRNE